MSSLWEANAAVGHESVVSLLACHYRPTEVNLAQLRTVPEAWHEAQSDQQAPYPGQEVPRCHGRAFQDLPLVCPMDHQSLPGTGKGVGTQQQQTRLHLQSSRIY